MNFCAIDFETATAGRNSACSVAVVDVVDGVVRDSYYTLIQPPGNKYFYGNINIHGIHPKDTANAPAFAQIWPELKLHLQGKMVVAHNSSFDMSVLKHCIQDFNCEPVDFKYCCTVKLAKKAWPFLENHKLNTVAEYLNISFQHHDALEDSRTCAYIPIRAAEANGACGVEDLAKKLGVCISNFTV